MDLRTAFAILRLHALESRSAAPDSPAGRKPRSRIGNDCRRELKDECGIVLTVAIDGDDGDAARGACTCRNRYRLAALAVMGHGAKLGIERRQAEQLGASPIGRPVVNEHHLERRPAPQRGRDFGCEIGNVLCLVMNRDDNRDVEIGA